MKILWIRGRNLASLEGGFVIDFTREPLLSAGIFAITGPTGSGKSTILDALCLALFGRSPRQAAARESGVELRDGEAGSLTQGDPRTILRKGSAEGSASAAFAGLDGNHWESAWNVRRARNHPSGKLQDYTLQLTNLTSGIPFPGTKTEILRETERLIGLTYEQFTRSVLLAQGEFTAFLKANRDDKASLLEKITGTSIYSRISETIFSRSREADASLKELHDRLSGIYLPGEEQIRQLEREEKQGAAEVEAFGKQRDKLKKGLEWHRQRESLEEEGHEAGIRLAAAEAALEAAAGRESHLRLVEKTQPVRPLIHSLREKRESCLQKQKAEEAITALKEAAAKEQEELAAGIKTAEEAAQAAAAVTVATRPLLLRARELDTLLSGQHQKATEAVAQKSTALERHQQLAEEFGSQAKALENLRREKTGLEEWLRENEPRRGIAENATLIVSLLENALSFRKEAAELTDLTGRAEEKALLLHKEKKQLEERAAEKEKQIRELIGQWEEVRERMAAIPAEQLSEAQKLHTAEMVRTSAMCSCWSRLYELTVRKSELEREWTDHRSALAKEGEDLERCAEEAGKLEVSHKQALRMVNQARLATAGNVEKLREQLLPGEACPVCGSIGHPWAEEKSRVHAMLGELENEELRLGRIWQEKVKEQARLTQSCRHHRDAIAKAQGDMARIDVVIGQVTAEWKEWNPGEELLSLPAETREGYLEKSTEQHRSKAEEAGKALEGHKKLTEAADRIRKNLDETRTHLNRAKEELSAATGDIRLLESENRERASQREKTAARYREIMNTAGTHLIQPGWEVKWADNPEAFTAKLKSFADAWNAGTGRLHEVSREETGLETECKNLGNRVAEAAGNLSQTECREKEAKEELAAAKQERQLLFEGKEAGAVEEELARREETCNQRLRELRNKAEIIKSGIAQQEGSLRQLREDRNNLNTEIDSLSLRIREWLRQFSERESFPVDEEELNRLLAYPPEWVTAERTALQQLRDDLLQARFTWEERSKKLQQHLAKGAGTEDKTATESLLAETEETISQKNTQLSDIRFRLRSIQENKKVAGNLVQEMEIRGETAGKWKKLNDLLGSADGKKFRQIAQEYTLEFLLVYANVQLKELTGRYRLEVIPGSLALQVVDRDMGDEIRSVHSLSGGESFLVSLALALGLASLSSNRMTLESLFIDEGFGSLDPQTLGIAMDALERLRNQGRKVGVISHVQEMTERIRTQVRVVNKANGRSSVEVTVT